MHYALYVIFYISKTNVGSVCATEASKQFCPTSGESGSILMLKNKANRIEAEGSLSFTKGCDSITLGEVGDGNFRIGQKSTSPTVYTKLYCFLPWIADQYNLEYTIPEFDKV